jgi:hypothetical protein
MLSKQQKAFIDKKLASLSANYQIEAFASDRYFNSRETGRGYPVFIALVWRATGERETVWEVARCEYPYTAARKVDEIHAYMDSLFEAGSEASQ